MEIKAKMGEIRDLVKASSLNGIIDTPVISFESDRVKALNYDVATIGISSVIFGKNYFKSYIVEETVNVCFDAVMFLKLSKQISSETIVSIGFEKDKLILSSDKQRVTVPLLKGKVITSLPEFLEETSDGIKVGADYEVSKPILVPKKDFSGLNQDVTYLSVKNNNLYIKQESTDDYSFEEILVDNIDVSDFLVILTTEYLEAIFSSVISKEINIKISRTEDDAVMHLPAIIEDNNDNYSLILALALRLGNDK